MIELLYEIRLKGRQKQGECSAILFLSFMIIVLTVFSVNILPTVYLSSVRPVLEDNIQGIVSVIASVILIALLFQSYACLSYGCDRFMLKRAENKASGAGDIFYYFSPVRIVKLSVFLLKFNFLKLVMLAFLSSPCFICVYVFYTLSKDNFSALVCVIFAVFTVVFLLLSLSTYNKIINTFFLVRYRYIKGEYLNFSNLLSISQTEMRAKTKTLRALRWSFSGWFVLALLIIPAPYVWCYYRQTLACFAADAMS